MRSIQYVPFRRRHHNDRGLNRRSKAQGHINTQLLELARGPCLSLTLLFRLPEFGPILRRGFSSIRHDQVTYKQVVHSLFGPTLQRDQVTYKQVV